MAAGADVSSVATCTTCTFAKDFSNYWTATIYFRARNGTFKRVKQMGNVGFEQASAGMSVYCWASVSSNTKASVAASKKGFRMLVGDPSFRTEAQAKKYHQLTFTCLQTAMTRSGQTLSFPTKPCPAGIMVNTSFPACWDGVNLDSADRQSRVAYPSSDTYENNGPCPSTHPAKITQVFYEAVFDMRPFSDKSLWPTDTTQQLFVWSFGDKTGYGNHGNYVFGWKGDALQRAMDADCNVNCPTLKTQTIATRNQCTKAMTVKEDVDGWLEQLPGGMEVN